MQEADRDLVVKDNADALEERLRGGMDIDAANKNGWTLLHLAARHGSVKCMRV